LRLSWGLTGGVVASGSPMADRELEREGSPIFLLREAISWGRAGPFSRLDRPPKCSHTGSLLGSSSIAALLGVNRGCGLKRLCRIHTKSAPETNLNAISWHPKPPAILPSNAQYLTWGWRYPREEDRVPSPNDNKILRNIDSLDNVFRTCNSFTTKLQNLGSSKK